MAKASTRASTTPDLPPPEEFFWKRYSPHHECLLSFVSSGVVHGLVFGIMFLAGLAFLWARESEANQPPRIDVVQIEGGGDGFDIGGGEAGAPGQPDAKRTEATEPAGPTKNQAPPSPTDVQLKDLPQKSLEVPDKSDLLEKDFATASIPSLDAISQEANKIWEAGLKPVPKTQGPLGNPLGKGKTGTGFGLGGKGPGTGKGPGVGPGTGLGGPGGRKLTKQEIYAMRWHFDIGSDYDKDHVAKLDAAGVILIVPDPVGRFLEIKNLKQRPAQAVPISLEKYKDAVRWETKKPESLLGLARELRLPYVPPIVFILLPREREEQMAAAEAEYARKHSRDFRGIRRTHFTFRLRNGVFEPVVLRQE